MGERIIMASIAIMALGALTPAARADELRILATGVYESAVHDLAPPFARASGYEVSFMVVNAGTAAAKLEVGEAFDAVLSSAASIETLTAKRRVVVGSKVDVGRMRLGVGVKAGTPLPDIKTVDALRAAILAAPSVAYIDPKGGGTSGAFFAKMFEQLGVADHVQQTGIPCATGIDVDKAVASGSASMGLTQASEIISASGVAFAGFLPDGLQLVTLYSAAIPASARVPDGGEAFIRFLTGPSGAERLRKSGWDVIGGN